MRVGDCLIVGLVGSLGFWVKGFGVGVSLVVVVFDVVEFGFGCLGWVVDL